MPDKRNNLSTPDNNKEKSKLFYGWVVAIAGAGIVFAAANFQYIFGVFVRPLADNFGWSRAAISGAVTGRSITSSIYAPIVGSWSDRYGPKRFILFGVLLTGLSYLLAARISNLWELYLYLSVMTGLGLTNAFIPVVSTVTRWFGPRAAMANGIVMAGFGVAQVVLPPLVTFFILHYGLAASFIVLALVTWVTGIIAWRFIKSPPSSISPSTAKGKGIVTKDSPAASGGKDYSLSEALHNSIFWVMLIINVAVFLTSQMAVIHMVPAAIDSGIAPEAAAIILTLGGVGSTCGRLGLGALASRIGSKVVLILCLALQAFALFFLVWARDLYVFYGSATLLGFAYGGVIPIMPTMGGSYFGLKSLGSIFGVINIAQNVGMSIGPLLAGFIFDITRSYYIAFLSAAIMMVIVLLLSLLLKPPPRKGLAPPA